MDFADPTQREAFFLLHRDLPREGPGHPHATERALWMVPGLPARPKILDLACGPGGQTVTLAQLVPDAHITALDAHPPFLEQLRQSAAEAGVSEQISIVHGDFAQPPEGPFDLIWCEGAVYLHGFERALREWGALLEPGGSLAMTEAVWLGPEPSARVRACWTEYPEMTSIEACREAVRASGLELTDDFVLPDEHWWELYYDPLQARVEALRPGASEVLAQVLDEAQEEIDVRRIGADTYGYVFIVATRPLGA